MREEVPGLSEMIEASPESLFQPARPRSGAEGARAGGFVFAAGEAGGCVEAELPAEAGPAALGERLRAYFDLIDR